MRYHEWLDDYGNTWRVTEGGLLERMVDGEAVSSSPVSAVVGRELCRLSREVLVRGEKLSRSKFWRCF